MERASDEDLLREAKRLDRRFLTRDRDVGALVFLHKELSAGVILLRITPTTVEGVHRELGRIVQPPLNPYLPIAFYPTPTDKMPRLFRQ